MPGCCTKETAAFSWHDVRLSLAMRFFHLPPQWQREYRSLLAEWFVRRHRERVAELDREADGLQGANLMISGFSCRSCYPASLTILLRQCWWVFER